jgi:hypothetical protein
MVPMSHILAFVAVARVLFAIVKWAGYQPI